MTIKTISTEQFINYLAKTRYKEIDEMQIRCILEKYVYEVPYGVKEDKKGDNEECSTG